MVSKKFKIGTIADPLSSFDREAETTFFLLREGTQRGFENWIMELKDLFLRDGKVLAQAKRISVSQKKKKFFYDILEEQTLDLGSIHVLFLRKDPPVDLNYLNHLTMLEMLESRFAPPHLLSSPQRERMIRKGPLFINSPSGIKRANEKFFPLHFPGISPPTLVSQSESVLSSFIKEHKKVVLKPLNSSGGRGIFIIEHSNFKKESVLEGATIGFTDYVMLQKYIPEAKKGDKRILLFNGKPLGCFLRVPAKSDFRGNLHQGASWVKSAITLHEKKIIRKLKPALTSRGLLFVGLDVIGRYVTEVNTTSPMGIREINQIEHSHCEKIIFDSISFLPHRVN